MVKNKRHAGWIEPEYLERIAAEVTARARYAAGERGLSCPIKKVTHHA